ncbi:hypothetical protein [Alkalibacillus aidingensis]|uniref:hypothetical protein n=1 Tax=Alkalibacillus aidingensis TaxID=2747607 RepID=UPI001660A61E|nr:hypothetical protein [Alkalibacillus aidingensis]
MSGRNVLFILLVLVILAFPLVVDFHSVLSYYLVMTPLLVFAMIRLFQEEQIKEKRYQKWKQLRQQNKWQVIFRYSVISFVVIVWATLFGQYVAEGRTPVWLMKEMPVSATIMLLMIVVFFSVASGAIQYYENGKKYGFKSLKE